LSGARDAAHRSGRGHADPEAPVGPPPWSLWIALAFAFSPVALELARDWPMIFAAASLAVPVGLLARTARLRGRASGAAAPARALSPALGRRLGASLVAAGGCIELLGIASGAWSVARAGPALAVAGVLMWAHRWPLREAALALWLVPVPAFAYVTTTPVVESAYGAAAAALLGVLGVPVELSGPMVRSGQTVLELQPAYNGLHVAWLLALLGWYGALRRGGGLTEALRRALLAALLAPPVQLGATALALAAVALGAPGVARAWLEHGLWIAVAAAGIVQAERRAAAPPEPGDGTRSRGSATPGPAARRYGESVATRRDA